MGRYLITGSSRGIGAETVRQLSEAGHEVIGVVRPGGSCAAGAAAVWQADLSAPDTLAESMAIGLAELGDSPLDGIVHAAGIVRPGLFSEPSVAELTEQFTVNVTAAAELTRLLLPALRAARGTVVLVNSGSGLNARAPLGAYGASKFALRAYAEALRQEEPSLRVSTVYPGRTATAMQKTVRAAEDGDYDETQYLTPSTVAGVIVTVLTLPADGVITDVTLRPR